MAQVASSLHGSLTDRVAGELTLVGDVQPSIQELESQLKLYEHQLEKTPQDAALNHGAAQILLQLGRLGGYRGAGYYARRAVALEPEDPNYRLTLSVVLARSNQPEESGFHQRKAR